MGRAAVVDDRRRADPVAAVHREEDLAGAPDDGAALGPRGTRAAAPPPPPGGGGLALGSNLPSAPLTKSRGLAPAIRSAVQYLTMRCCSALALAWGSPAATGATAGTRASSVNRAAAAAVLDRRMDVLPLIAGDGAGGFVPTA